MSKMSITFPTERLLLFALLTLAFSSSVFSEAKSQFPYNKRYEHGSKFTTNYLHNAEKSDTQEEGFDPSRKTENEAGKLHSHQNTRRMHLKSNHFKSLTPQIKQANFGEACERTSNCNSSSQLFCINKKCSCMSEKTLFDEEKATCVALPGHLCNFKKGNACVKNAECDSKRKVCKCIEGYKNVEGKSCEMEVMELAKVEEEEKKAVVDEDDGDEDADEESRDNSAIITKQQLIADKTTAREPWMFGESGLDQVLTPNNSTDAFISVDQEMNPIEPIQIVQNSPVIENISESIWVNSTEKIPQPNGGGAEVARDLSDSSPLLLMPVPTKATLTITSTDEPASGDVEQKFEKLQYNETESLTEINDEITSTIPTIKSSKPAPTSSSTEDDEIKEIDPSMDDDIKSTAPEKRNVTLLENPSIPTSTTEKPALVTEPSTDTTSTVTEESTTAVDMSITTTTPTTTTEIPTTTTEIPTTTTEITSSTTEMPSSTTEMPSSTTEMPTTTTEIPTTTTEIPTTTTTEMPTTTTEMPTTTTEMPITTTEMPTTTTQMPTTTTQMPTTTREMPTTTTPMPTTTTQMPTTTTEMPTTTTPMPTTTTEMPTTTTQMPTTTTDMQTTTTTNTSKISSTTTMETTTIAQRPKPGPEITSTIKTPKMTPETTTISTQTTSPTMTRPSTPSTGSEPTNLRGISRLLGDMCNEEYGMTCGKHAECAEIGTSTDYMCVCLPNFSPVNNSGTDCEPTKKVYNIALNITNTLIDGKFSNRSHLGDKNANIRWTTLINSTHESINYVPVNLIKVGETCTPQNTGLALNEITPEMNPCTRNAECVRISSFFQELHVCKCTEGFTRTVNGKCANYPAKASATFHSDDFKWMLVVANLFCSFWHAVL